MQSISVHFGGFMPYVQRVHQLPGGFIMRPYFLIVIMLALALGVIGMNRVSKLPEIIDYELRRELIRLNKTSSIKRLNELKTFISYTPITTQAMLLASEFWGTSQKTGKTNSRLKHWIST